MPIIREKHQENYVVIDKGYLKDERLSNGAKGLLTIMLSMPDTWRFNIPHLTSLSRKQRASLKTELQELIDNKYVIRKKGKNEKGQFEHIYFIFEGGYEDDNGRL